MKKTSKVLDRMIDDAAAEHAALHAENVRLREALQTKENDLDTALCTLWIVKNMEPDKYDAVLKVSVLRSTAQSLINSLPACLLDDIRAAIGNTNTAVIEHWISELRAALDAAPAGA